MPDAVDHHRVGLVFHGAGHDRGAMGRAIGVHVAIGHDDQFRTQLAEGPRAFRELDVEAHQQADPDAVPQGGGVAVARREDAAVGGPQVGLAVFQGDAVGSDQQGGVVIAAGVRLGDADRHRNVTFTGDALHRADRRVVERLGEGGDVVFAGEAGQVGFREHHQFGVRRTVGDGRQGAFQVVRGVAIATGDLDEFDFHRNSLLFSALFGTRAVRMQGSAQYAWRSPRR